MPLLTNASCKGGRLETSEPLLGIKEGYLSRKSKAVIAKEVGVERSLPWRWRFYIRFLKQLPDGFFKEGAMDPKA